MADSARIGRTSARMQIIGCLLVAACCVLPSLAVSINFDNCLSQSLQKDQPYQLQFVPLFVDASYILDAKDDSNHILRVEVRGNVTGSFPKVNSLPPASDVEYWNSNSTDDNNGKIVDVPFPRGANKFTTLFNQVNVATYEPWSDSVKFCEGVQNGSCPLAPIFQGNA